jgi:hypothetical protein
MKVVNLLLVLTIFSSLPLVSQAEIYKWKDKDGTIRYTDTPPPSNIKQESIGGKKVIQPTGKDPLAPVASGQAEPSKAAPDKANKEAADAKLRQRNAEIEKKNKQENETQAKIKAENCKAAKANFETYNQGGRVYKMNEKGEREYMDDKDLDAGKVQAQKDINQNCN